MVVVVGCAFEAHGRVEGNPSACVAVVMEGNWTAAVMVVLVFGLGDCRLVEGESFESAELSSDVSSPRPPTWH